MLLPVGNVLHKELSTSFVNFSEFIRELRQSRFSGYVRLNFWQYEGIMILEYGKIVQAYSSEKEQFITGTEALFRIISKSRDKEGVLDIHKLSDEVALVLASALGAEMQKMYELPNGNTMEKLMDNLEEISFTGYLDVQFGGKAGFGTLYFLEGMAVESVLMSPLGIMECGEEAHRKILNYSTQNKLSVKSFCNDQFIQICEDGLFVYPDADNPQLKFWSNFIQFISDKIEKLTKKENFIENWMVVCKQNRESLEILDPELDNVSFKNGKLQINGVFSESKFEDELLLTIKAVIADLPWSTRFRLKPAKLLKEFCEIHPINYELFALSRVETIFERISAKK